MELKEFHHGRVRVIITADGRDFSEVQAACWAKAYKLFGGGGWTEDGFILTEDGFIDQDTPRYSGEMAASADLMALRKAVVADVPAVDEDGSVAASRWRGPSRWS